MGMGNGGHSSNKGIQTNCPARSTKHTFSRSLYDLRNGRTKYFIWRWVSTRGRQFEPWLVTVMVCPGHDDAFAAGGAKKLRRGEVPPTCRLFTELLINLIDPRAFGIIDIPTSGKERPKSLRYAYVAGIGRFRGAMTLEDLECNLCVPERMERSQPSQHLGFALQYIPEDTSKVDTCRITIPNAYTSAFFDIWHLASRNMSRDNNSGAMNGVVPPRSGELSSSPSV